jgi:2-dehydro-3-deoxyphosphogluconate aldolase/(4S)-4-hydroxy-2-oxoglutarate aldolase
MTTFSWDAFHAVPIVGILRRYPLATMAPLAEAAMAAGLTTLEITADTPEFDACLARLHAVTDGAMNLGAGTVCSTDDLARARAAGAAFIVTPVVVPEVIAAAGMPVFAGAYTPTEIYNAWSAGAAMVKVFPADGLGPDFIRAVRGPFPQIPLLPTGGVTRETLPAFARAGAAGFGMGSPLFPAPLIQAGDWGGLTAHIRDIITVYRATR